MPDLSIAVVPTEVDLSILASAVRRRYRIRQIHGQVRLTISRPTPSGSVCLEHWLHDSRGSAVNDLRRRLLAHFASDFDDLLERFESESAIWTSGRPGVRPRSSAWKARAQASGNLLCRIAESYAAAYHAVTAYAEAHRCDLDAHVVSGWLQGGIDALATGEGGRIYRLEELLHRTPSPWSDCGIPVHSRREKLDSFGLTTTKERP